MTLLYLGPPSHALVDYHMEKRGMPLLNAVGKTVKVAQLLKSRRRCLVHGLRGVCLMIV